MGQLLKHAGDLRSLYPWSTCIKVPEGTKISHCVLLVTFLKKERWLLFVCVKEPVTSSAGEMECNH